MKRALALIAGAALMLALQTGGVSAHHGCEYDCSTTTSSTSTESTSTSSTSTTVTTTTITESTTTTETTKATPKPTPRPTTTPPSTATDAPANPGDGQGLWIALLALAAIGGVTVIFLPRRRSN